MALRESGNRGKEREAFSGISVFGGRGYIFMYICCFFLFSYCMNDGCLFHSNGLPTPTYTICVSELRFIISSTSFYFQLLNKSSQVELTTPTTSPKPLALPLSHIQQKHLLSQAPSPREQTNSKCQKNAKNDNIPNHLWHNTPLHMRSPATQHARTSDYVGR